MARTRTAYEVDPAVIDDNAQGRPETAAFAKTLNHLLIKKGIHQDDLAQAIGMSTGIISDYRRGKKEPKLSALLKIADYLGVDCHYLMTGVKSQNATFLRDAGLSQKAAERLKANKGVPPLSPVIESNYFWEMLSNIWKSVRYADKRGDWIKEYFIKYTADKGQTVPPIDMDDFFRYQANRAAGKLFDEISKLLYDKRKEH